MRDKKKDRVAMTINVDREIAESMRATHKGQISELVNEMFYLASGNGKVACPECSCEFAVPAGRRAYMAKKIKNPLGD